ncbi:MAG TPA: toprim domain-containing protein, partial [Turneriella sp.]|nr:toprim domain-containing protein [Turneriella sp.]
DLRGQVIAFGGRLVREKANAGKYINSPESPLFNKSHTVYRLGDATQAIRREGFVILCEGYLDALGLFERGLENAVAPLGTAFTADQAKQIKRFTDNVVFFFDNDKAGTDAAFKALQIARAANLAGKVVHPLFSKEKQDPFDLSRSLSNEDMRTVIRDAHQEVDFITWYFFRYHYETTELAQMKKALREFYDYMRLLETELERDAFLKAAAAVLQIDIKILQKDFLESLQDKKNTAAWLGAERKPVTEKQPKQVKEVTKQEKEIIALALRFPELMEEEVLLNELPWESDTAYLLFSFFQDRLRIGNTFDWENLSSAMQFLPDALSGLLAAIIMEYEDTLNASVELTVTDAKLNLRRLVRTLVLQTINNRIAMRQKRISELDAQGEDIDELMLEQQEDIDKRIQWQRM